MRNPSWRWRTIALALLFTAMAGGVLLTTALDRSPGPLKEETQPLLVKTPGEDLLLTEFGDFQCPHCARFALHILPALEHDLIQPGTVRFEYRHYPFLGPQSLTAAEASECARDQGQFHRYHLDLYRMTLKEQELTEEKLLTAARDLGLETDAFRQCLVSGAKRARVLEDREYGRSLGVRGTPTLFLEDRELEWNNYVDLREKVRAMAGRASLGAPPARQ